MRNFNFSSASIQLEADKRLTCANLETPEYGCNCRGCDKCGDGCTQKCSMLNKNIKGSHDCATWYRMDPKYTTKFLKTNAVVTGTVNDCTCAGCNGNEALDFCPNDIPDKNSNYMDIETAKAKGKIGKMRLAINDDMLDPEKCKNNAFCEKHTCLPVHLLAVIFGLDLSLCMKREYLQFNIRSPSTPNQ